ncbi:hypothetical protein HOY80DRAFT_962431 [Tuber brumale]|nr:hypothetical protein HOY80DRAFT_962431 [Tuber brumale]
MVCNSVMSLSLSWENTGSAILRVLYCIYFFFPTCIILAIRPLLLLLLVALVEVVEVVASNRCIIVLYELLREISAQIAKTRMWGRKKRKKKKKQENYGILWYRQGPWVGMGFGPWECDGVGTGWCKPHSLPLWEGREGRWMGVLNRWHGIMTPGTALGGSGGMGDGVLVFCCGKALLKGGLLPVSYLPEQCVLFITRH